MSNYVYSGAPYLRKFGNPAINLKNFGSHVTVRTYVRTPTLMIPYRYLVK